MINKLICWLIGHKIRWEYFLDGRRKPVDFKDLKVCPRCGKNL